MGLFRRARSAAASASASPGHKGDLVRVRAIPVPGFPAPPQYEPDPSEPNGSWDVLPESRQVEETKVEQN